MVAGRHCHAHRRPGIPGRARTVRARTVVMPVGRGVCRRQRLHGLRGAGLPRRRSITIPGQGCRWRTRPPPASGDLPIHRELDRVDDSHQLGPVIGGRPGEVLGKDDHASALDVDDPYMPLIVGALRVRGRVPRKELAPVARRHVGRQLKVDPLAGVPAEGDVNWRRGVPRRVVAGRRGGSLGDAATGRYEGMPRYPGAPPGPAPRFRRSPHQG